MFPEFQKVKSYTVMAAAGQKKKEFVHSIQSQLCSQSSATVGCKASGLHTATLLSGCGNTSPQPSASSEFIKAGISMYEERRKSKAESNGKPVTEFVCITSSM